MKRLEEVGMNKATFARRTHVERQTVNTWKKKELHCHERVVFVVATPLIGFVKIVRERNRDVLIFIIRVVTWVELYVLVIEGRGADKAIVLTNFPSSTYPNATK